MRLPLLALALLAPPGRQEGPQRRMTDSGFEALSAGPLATTGPVNTGWEVQRHGRDAILDRLSVACVEDPTAAKSGRKCLSLSIPKDTVGFEFVTVGQRHALPAGRALEASVWVRWAGGPEAAPPGASATSGHPSAIVSFWARHRDETGDFAGRDEWLFDGRWTRLSFRFRATDPGLRTLVYVSLLPNQAPADTTVLMDDFELTASAGRAEPEGREGELVQDAGFDGQKSGAAAPPWYFANLGGKGISGAVAGEAGRQIFTLAMGPGTTNYESAQLWQHVELREGVRYEIAARVRWDNFAPDAPPPILNYGIFNDATRTWYGPVDQVLEKSADWKVYRFPHVPPAGGPWKLYVQLNGWGNFGKGVRLSVDEISCRPAR